MTIRVSSLVTTHEISNSKRPNWEQQYNINVDYAKKQKHCMYVQI